jgi:hypothetical protein
MPRPLLLLHFVTGLIPPETRTAIDRPAYAQLPLAVYATSGTYSFVAGHAVV